MTTVMPSRASRRVMALPMPPAPPVINATGEVEGVVLMIEGSFLDETKTSGETNSGAERQRHVTRGQRCRCGGDAGHVQPACGGHRPGAEQRHQRHHEKGAGAERGI